MKSQDEIFKTANLDTSVEANRQAAYFGECVSALRYHFSLSPDERLGVQVTVSVSGEEDRADVEELINNLIVNVGLSYVDSEGDARSSRPDSLQNAFHPIPNPATPSPMPQGSDELIKADGIFVSSTPFSGENKSLLQEGDKWIAKWMVEVDAVRVRMNIAKPLAALTSTITLRDRPAQHSVHNSMHIRNDNDDDDELVDSWDNINLLEDLSPSLKLPSSRLPQSYQNVDIPPPIPEKTLKRSFRILIPISSALSVRMRAVNIPFLLSGEENEKPHLVLGLELENCTDSALRIQDANIQLKEASVADDSAELVARRHELTESDIPMHLLASEQQKLIYVVVFHRETSPTTQTNHTSHRHSKEFNRPRRFNVRIRVMANAEQGTVFEMKWNSVIDISNALVEDWKKHNTTVDAIAVSNARPTSIATRSSQRTSGPVAGSRRYTLTSLQQASEMAAAAKSHTQTRPTSEDSDSESTDSTSSNLKTASSKETVLLSVSVLKPTRSMKLGQRSPSIFSPGMYTSPKEDNNTIKALDIFPVEVFIFNKSSVARRFVVNFATHNQINARNQGMSVEERLLDESPAHEEDVGVVPLENFVRFGPLQPGSCQSVNINFLALKDGVHTIDRLELYDPDTGFRWVLKTVSSF